MSLFNPSRDDVRRFFIETWRKVREGLPLTPMEMHARDRLVEHPEYHALLESGDDALARDFTPEGGQTNPFLHLSLHLAIAEQLQVDQPPGLKAAYDALRERTDSAHDAEHVVLECLAETMWRAQRDHSAPDGAAYVACVRRHAGQPNDR